MLLGTRQVKLRQPAIGISSAHHIRLDEVSLAMSDAKHERCEPIQKIDRYFFQRAFRAVHRVPAKDRLHAIHKQYCHTTIGSG